MSVFAAVATVVVGAMVIHACYVIVKVLASEPIYKQASQVRPRARTVVEGVNIDAIVGACVFCDHRGFLAARVVDIKGENPITVCHRCYEEMRKWDAMIRE